jgi:predicted small lipoprotein YifL
MRTLLVTALLVVALALSACGRKGWPQPAGPPDQVTYPRAYPAY